MNTVLESSEAAILGRVIKPAATGWSPAAAQAILALGFDEDDRGKMTTLLDRAKDGELTDTEAAELERYRRVGRFLEMLKSRARFTLQSATVD